MSCKQLTGTFSVRKFAFDRKYWALAVLNWQYRLKKAEGISTRDFITFISAQKYNDYIKVVLTKCGITRLVTVLNPITRKEEKQPINEIGSSHMARRTFIANIYNKVPDPNVIGSMTGHVEGSRAFARYRTIEEEVKKSLVDILG